MKDSGKDAILGAVSQLMNGVSVPDPKVMLQLTALMNRNQTVEICEEMTEREIATLLARDP